MDLKAVLVYACVFKIIIFRVKVLSTYGYCIIILFFNGYLQMLFSIQDVLFNTLQSNAVLWNVT